MAIFGNIFAVLSAFKAYAHRRHPYYAKFIPSGIAFAIGFLNVPSFTLARLVGGIVELMYHRQVSHKDKGNDIKLIVIASGFVLGEGVVSVISLILRTFGIDAISCWGCSPGRCGGCSH